MESEFHFVCMIFHTEVYIKMLSIMFVYADIVCPTLQTMLHHLNKVHDDWFVIGIALNVPYEKLRDTEMHYERYGSKRCMAEMTQYWLDFPNASWEQVVKSLELVGHSTLASTIKQQYLRDQPSCEWLSF